MKFDEERILKAVCAEYQLEELSEKQLKTLRKSCRKIRNVLSSIFGASRTHRKPRHRKELFLDRLNGYAQDMRDNPTRAEAVLNKELQKMFSAGECEHQKPMGRYILDFYIPSAKLCIEVDGGYHSVAEQLQKDAVRDNWLKSQGITVKRFTNERVIYHPKTVAEEIFNLCLMRFESRIPQVLHI